MFHLKVASDSLVSGEPLCPASARTYISSYDKGGADGSPADGAARLRDVETPLDGLGDQFGSLHDFGAP